MNKINKYNTSTYEFKKKINEQTKEIKKLNEKINELNNNNITLNKIIEQKTNEISSILNSKSWKITKPLRNIMETIKKNENKKQERTVNEKNEKKYVHDYKNLKIYDSYYQEDEDFTGLETDIKILAFYLPQFHEFKENNEWWGKGFTEWTNTKKAKPHFENHYQPREPHDDIGYYKLDNIETIKKQVELAKKHGIYGFCFYYYWFSGKRLMEKPGDMLLEHTEIDFPFCLCWANENWTRTWDGSENEILIKQDYSDNDYKNFIIDIKKYFDDKRYIRIDGKPLIMIYNPTQIPNLEKLISEWRKTAKEIGIGELVILTKDDLARDDFKNMEFADGEFDFVPNGIGHPSCMVTGLDTEKAYDYTQLVDDIKQLYIDHFPPKQFYYSCTMGWDNSARRKENYRIYCNYSLRAFYKWLRTIIEQTRYRNEENKRFIFINAWNEWAEGTYLEPDKKYGYANINTLSRAIFDLSLNTDYKIIKKNNNKLNTNPKIAIHAHVFYTDILEEIISNLNKMPYKYDLYISTDSDSKIKKIKEIISNKLINAEKIDIKKFLNHGRDVLPFLLQMKSNVNEYDYICHIHTKKTITDIYGNNWRKYLYYNLFGTNENLKSIFEIFNNNPNIGIIYPIYYKEIVDMIGIGANKENLNKLLKCLNLKPEFDCNNISFPAGTMFWARSSALKPLFSIDAKTLGFEEENGQTDGTMAHAIERSLCIIAETQGYKSLQIINKTEEEKK